MSKLILEVGPGETIEDAATEAQQIADTAARTVMFEFNGVDCFAVPGGDPARLTKNQHRAQVTRPNVFSDEEWE